MSIPSWVRSSRPGVPVPPSSDRPRQFKSTSSLVMPLTSLECPTISATHPKAWAAMRSRWVSADHSHPPAHPDAAREFLIRFAPIFFAGKFGYDAHRSGSDLSTDRDHKTTAAIP